MIGHSAARRGGPTSGGRCSALRSAWAATSWLCPWRARRMSCPSRRFIAIAALLALVFLKGTSASGRGGLALCVIGAIAIGYPPEGAGAACYLGIAFAFLAAFGWAAEGVCVTSGMDFIEPAVALNVYQIVSSLLYAGIIVPLALWHLSASAPGCDIPGLLARAFSSPGVGCFALAGVVGCISYRCWYKAMNMAGVSRAMALNITYALWGVLFGALFTDVEITCSLVIGAAAIFAGMFLVIGNPRDIINLRNVSS
ncbi:MAG: EamA family transporter [Bilophila wadsworthia]